MNTAAQNDLVASVCATLNSVIQYGDAYQLADYVVVEPPFEDPEVDTFIAYLRQSYPADDEGTSDQRIEETIRQVVTETEESEDSEGRPIQSWSSMVTFLFNWMVFLRDVDVEKDNYLEIYQRLKDLLEQANSALQHPTKGVIMLPTIMSYSKIFAKVAMGLDKRPDLIQHLIEESMGEEGQRESLPEKAANVVRQAFITCLNDRNTVPGGIKNGKPDGKKVGIYKMANTCLRILMQADKPESCETIFRNIMNSSPPLHIYPVAERVTFLYYLGRYQFAHTQFYAAQLVLQQAWDQCSTHQDYYKQRRLILTYLVASNLILGRFPSQTIYQLKEAKGFREAFVPITQAIRKGDLEAFRRITKLDLSHPSASFLLRHRIFYQIGNYCEVLVWRSLARKVFCLTWQQENGEAEPALQFGETPKEKKASTLDLNALLLAFRFLEGRAKNKNAAMSALDMGPGRRPFASAIQDLNPLPKSTYIDPDFDGADGLEARDHEMDVLEIECICSSLITQGLMVGYISRTLMKVGLSSVTKKGGVDNAFPNPWANAKSRNTDDVLGWKKDAGNVSAGQVVHLSGARPVGE